jgi:hypothetical protein
MTLKPFAAEHLYEIISMTAAHRSDSASSGICGALTAPHQIQVPSKNDENPRTWNGSMPLRAFYCTQLIQVPAETYKNPLTWTGAGERTPA